MTSLLLNGASSSCRWGSAALRGGNNRRKNPFNKLSTQVAGETSSVVICSIRSRYLPEMWALCRLDLYSKGVPLNNTAESLIKSMVLFWIPTKTRKAAQFFRKLLQMRVFKEDAGFLTSNHLTTAEQIKNRRANINKQRSGQNRCNRGRLRGNAGPGWQEQSRVRVLKKRKPGRADIKQP